MSLSKEEIEKLEEIYNDKFRCVSGWFNKKQGRYYTYIIFSNNQKIKRQTAAWRLEVKLGRKLNTSRTGGNETCDHIDNNKLNDNIDNLQLLTINENNRKQNGYKLTENDVLNILNSYYNEKMYICDIAKLYTNIDRITIYDIIYRKTWKHIPFEVPDNFIRPNNNYKLTENDVLSILNYYYINKINQCDIAKLYPNIDNITIHYIVNRKSWKHIPFEVPDNFIKHDTNYKLTKNDVIAIHLKSKILGISSKKLADEYNINKGTINHILNNKIWKRIQIPDLYDFYIGNKHIIAIPNQIIIINNIKYKFLGKIIDNNILPNINSIYINNNGEVVKRKNKMEK